MKKHPTKISGFDGTLEDLAVYIAKMKLDKISKLLSYLEKDFKRQADKSEKNKRLNLAKLLNTAKNKLLLLAGAFSKAGNFPSQKMPQKKGIGFVGIFKYARDSFSGKSVGSGWCGSIDGRAFRGTVKDLAEQIAKLRYDKIAELFCLLEKEFGYQLIANKKSKDKDFKRFLKTAQMKFVTLSGIFNEIFYACELHSGSTAIERRRIK